MPHDLICIEQKEHEILHLVFAIAHRFHTDQNDENKNRLLTSVATAADWFDGKGDRYTFAKLNRLLSMN
ncbi:MAG: hypothetical protein AB7E47_03480 [Desulfovibrionaceae bacterium]